MGRTDGRQGGTHGGRKSDGVDASGHRSSTRRPSKSTMTATVFAVSTLATMAVVFAIVMLVTPVSLGIRLLPDLRMPGLLRFSDSPVTDSVGVGVSLLLMYAMARLTRNATLESDRVKSEGLRRTWIAFFEILWFLTFVLSSEALATCVDGLLPSLVGNPVSWGIAVAVVSARCLLTRHDHHSKHVACEAMRATGRSAIACCAWATASLLMLSYEAFLSDPRWLGVVIVPLVAVAALVIRPCMTEGRHRCDGKHDPHRHGKGKHSH